MHTLPLGFTRPLRGCWPRAVLGPPVETKHPFVKFVFHKVRFCSCLLFLFWYLLFLKMRKKGVFTVRARFWKLRFTWVGILFAFFTTPNRPKLHTLQCARVFGRPNCIPYSARAPSDSPGLGAVHFGGPSEAKFVYLTVRARPWEAKFAYLTVRALPRIHHA